MNDIIQHWDTQKLGKPYYFFYFYVPKKLSDNEAFSQESIDIQHGIWHFKDGTDQQYFTNIFIEKIKNSFSNVQNLTLACIPASTKVANTCRYRIFSENVCSTLGMNNGFDHISIEKEKEPKHLSNVESYCVLNFDKEFFKGKSVILFDDVVTKGNSMKNFIFQLESLGANVIACFSIGRTYYSRTDGFNPIHPWSETSLRSGLKVEPVSTDISISTEDIFKHEIRIDSDPQIPNLVEPCIKHESQKVEPPVSQIQYVFGDNINFGSYYGHPIEWEVLEQKGNNVLLISKYGLTCREYNDKLENTSWAECTLREWLNKTFLEKSFSSMEKVKMIKHKVNAEVVSGHELNPGENTMDFVHILSVDDYERFYDSNVHHWHCYLAKDKKTKRQCWLRNYGLDRTRAAFVGRSGTLHLGGSEVIKPRNTVRPVILIRV